MADTAEHQRPVPGLGNAADVIVTDRGRDWRVGRGGLGFAPATRRFVGAPTLPHDWRQHTDRDYPARDTDLDTAPDQGTADSSRVDGDGSGAGRAANLHARRTRRPLYPTSPDRSPGGSAGLRFGPLGRGASVHYADGDADADRDNRSGPDQPGGATAMNFTLTPPTEQEVIEWLERDREKAIDALISCRTGSFPDNPLVLRAVLFDLYDEEVIRKNDVIYRGDIDSRDFSPLLVERRRIREGGA